MISPLGQKTTPKLTLQESVATLLRDLIHERTGVFCESDRLEAMLEKIEPRALARGCTSYLDYYYILKYDEGSQAEWRRMMDAFSVQETYFWRELDQVTTLVDRVVPEWFRKSSKPLRIWSAACATGEEPYSIAIALAEAGWANHPIEIIASDASESALAKAKEGIYRERSFRALPPGLREKYFTPEKDSYRLRSEVKTRVSFHWANLMRMDDLPTVSAVEVIYCRNVFIYFSTSAIRQVVTSFAQRLPKGGMLFVGASESLLKLTKQFELEEMGGAFGYVRNGEPA